MNAFTAHWFDGVSSRMHAVTVSRVGAQVQLSGEDVEHTAPHAALRITPRLARTPRSILFPCGGRVLVADHAMLDEWFPSEDRLQRLVARLERHAHVVALSIVICIAASISTFVWGVPWLADRIAAQIPSSMEAKLGDSVLGQLDGLFGLKPSTLDEARREQLTARFRRIADPLPDGASYRLVFRHAPGIGANALALPGGTVIVTDELTWLFDDDREFDAVVAHELGHQQERHALRQTLRSSFVAIVAAFFAGDVSAASTVVIGVPTFLLQSHYSRGFEEAADRFAIETLAKRGESPAWFAEAMRKLDEEQGDSGEDIAYLSSHPSSSERILAAERAGEAFLLANPDKVREAPGYDACAEEGICDETDEEDCVELEELCEADDSACVDALDDIDLCDSATD